MENQDIKWETWEEQPQETNDQQQGWGEQPQQEQPQQQGWGEQPQQEQPQVNWGESSQEENIPTWGEQSQPQQEQPQANWDEQQENIFSWEEPSPTNETNPSPEELITPPTIEDDVLVTPPIKEYSVLGRINRISVDTDLFYLNINPEKVLRDLNDLNLTPLDSDGRYDFSPTKDTDLGKVIQTIFNISQSQGLKISNCFVYKNNPNEASLNVFKGKPKSHFIYFIQGDFNSGDVVLDLSSLGGPSKKILDSSPNILTLIPGWVPFSISKNTSNKEFIALVGTLD